MGPEFGTEKYENQVRIIKKKLDDCKDMIKKNIRMRERVLVMYVLDTSFSRADHEWKQENGILT